MSWPRPAGRRATLVRGLLPILLVGALLHAAAAGAQTVGKPAGEVEGEVQGEVEGEVEAVVLIHHPEPDHADPFGVAFRSGDTFSSRYRHLVADAGRFDFPYFVADGVESVRALPQPAAPYAGTLGAYANATAARLLVPAVASLTVDATGAMGNDAVRITVAPRAQVQDPQAVQSVHLWVALAEDAIHHQPPAAISNGVTEHRFTVRALQDLGAVDLATGASSSHAASFALDPSWAVDRLMVAAWLQADAAPGRFVPHEVLQAAQAPWGANVTQVQKAVLLEGYSATWCNPCLYGDLALEELAIRHAGAEPLEPVRDTYLRGPLLPLLLGAVLGVLVVLGLARLGRRRGGDGGSEGARGRVPPAEPGDGGRP